MILWWKRDSHHRETCKDSLLVCGQMKWSYSQLLYTFNTLVLGRDDSSYETWHETRNLFDQKTNLREIIILLITKEDFILKNTLLRVNAHYVGVDIFCSLAFSSWWRSLAVKSLYSTFCAKIRRPYEKKLGTAEDVITIRIIE